MFDVLVAFSLFLRLSFLLQRTALSCLFFSLAKQQSLVGQTHTRTTILLLLFLVVVIAGGRLLLPTVSLTTLKALRAAA